MTAQRPSLLVDTPRGRRACGSHAHTRLASPIALPVATTRFATESGDAVCVPMQLRAAAEPRRARPPPTAAPSGEVGPGTRRCAAWPPGKSATGRGVSGRCSLAPPSIQLHATARAAQSPPLPSAQGRSVTAACSPVGHAGEWRLSPRRAPTTAVSARSAVPAQGCPGTGLSRDSAVPGRAAHGTSVK